MSDQKIKLSIDGDASGLLKAVKTAMAQIEQESKKMKLSPEAAKGAPKGAPGVEAFNKSQKDAQGQILKTRNEQIALESANRFLSQKENILSKIAKHEQEMAKAGKDATFWAEKRKEYENAILVLKRQQATLGGGGGNGGGFGGPNIPRGGITSASGLANAIGVPGMVIGGAASAIAAIIGIEKARVLFSQTGLRERTAAASSLQMEGQGGQRLTSILNGGANEDIIYKEERLQAAKIAEETMKSNLAEQNRAGRLLTHPTEFINAAAKSLTFGLWNPLGGEITSKQSTEQSAIQAEQFNALKSGPGGALRTAVADKYLKDWRRNLDFQRQTGQSEGGFRDFLTNVNRAGFTDEEAMGTSSGIMRSGGSTRAAKENAGFALQMARQFDLTNADQAIGAISGQLGTGQMSRDALIKIQAEGTRIGVNQADFVEENRKFVEMASNVINQSYVSSGSGVDQLVETFGKFMSDRTTTGMAAGRNAYEAYQRQSNAQSGPSAVMRAAGMVNDPALKTLSGEAQASLYTMSQSDVNVDNPGLQAMANENPAITAAAKRAGVSPVQYLVNQYHGIQDKSMFVRKNTDTAISKLRDAYSSHSIRAGNDIPKLEGEALNLMRLEPAAQGLDEKGKMELVRAMAKSDATAADRLLQQNKVQTAAEANESRRPGDEMNRQQAEASRMANDLFVSIQKSIIPAAEATKNFTADINALVSAMRGGNLQQINAAVNRMNTNNPGFLSPQTQPSAGPPVNGPGVPAGPGH